MADFRRKRDNDWGWEDEDDPGTWASFARNRVEWIVSDNVLHKARLLRQQREEAQREETEPNPKSSG